MGTNYYTTLEEPFECCGRGGNGLHVGKSSAGWEFVFAAHEDPEIRSLADWRAFLAERIIFDEYGDEISLADFIALARSKRGVSMTRLRIWPRPWGPGLKSHNYADVEGYRFSTREFS